MKNTVFTGAATAIVTPLTADGVDYPRFGRLIDWQIEAGIDAIVVAGTTGEGSTLTDAEHKEVIRYCVERVAGRVPVIAGTGSNDIAYAIELTKYACEVGADAMLLVTPYYNKATQQGLIQSFTAIADASTKPCILYNVPGRTGCALTVDCVEALSHHKNIVGLKEASGNISYVAQVARYVNDDFALFSGNDDMIVPIMSLGGSGVISVFANICPKESHDIVDLCLKGDYQKARELQLKYLDLINALFIEVNPIPVKEAMNMLGMNVGGYRLPLCEMDEKNREILRGKLRILEA